MNAKARLESFIKRLPLPQGSHEHFLRAIEIFEQQQDEFAAVGVWLDRFYSEATLRELCVRQRNGRFRDRLRGLIFDAATYRRRRSLRKGVPLETLIRERITEATGRGQRLEPFLALSSPAPDDTVPSRRSSLVRWRLAGKSYPVDAPIDEANIELVFEWEDKQCRRLIREIKQEWRSSDLDDGDHPERAKWRITRALDELCQAEFPDPPGDLEHARRIIGVAVLIVSPEQVPILGELGKCEWSSQFAPVPENGDWFDKMLEANRQHAEPSPHESRPTTMDPRTYGREEVLFSLSLEGGRELRSCWGDLSQFIQLLQHAIVIWAPPAAAVPKEPPPPVELPAGNSNGGSHLPRAALVAGQQFELAQSKSTVSLTDKQAYAYVLEHVAESADGLPSQDTWERNLRTFRNARGAQKNHPRSGRSAGARSVVPANMIDHKPDETG